MTAAADYRFLLADGATGTNIGELPLTLSAPYTRTLGGYGIGSLTGTLPLSHPMLTTVNLEHGQEITVLRAGEPDWNGPITALSPSLDGSISVTAQEVSVYLQKRTVEEDKDYTGWDVYDAIRDLFSYILTKTSTSGDGMPGGAGTDINAALPRFNVSPASGAAGHSVVDGLLPGAPRYVASELFDRIVGDPDSPVDWKMDYQTGSTRQQCVRTLTLGAPLGVTRDHPITERTLYDITKEEDRMRAANRVHVVGAGGTYTLQNASDITVNSDVLLEAVFDESNVTDTAQLQSYARAVRVASYPPITTHTITLGIGVGPFPFDFCDVGDSIYLNLSEAVGVLHSVGHRRVTQIGRMPATAASPELMVLDISIPLDTAT